MTHALLIGDSYMVIRQEGENTIIARKQKNGTEDLRYFIKNEEWYKVVRLIQGYDHAINRKH